MGHLDEVDELWLDCPRNEPRLALAPRTPGGAPLPRPRPPPLTGLAASTAYGMAGWVSSKDGFEGGGVAFLTAAVV